MAHETGLELEQLAARKVALAALRRYVVDPPDTNGEYVTVLGQELLDVVGEEAADGLDADFCWLLLVEFAHLAVALTERAAIGFRSTVTAVCDELEAGGFKEF